MSGRLQEESPGKCCAYCQKPLEKKIFKSGTTETPSMLAKRNYCDHKCAAAHKYNPEHTCTHCKRNLSRETDFYFRKSGKTAGELIQPCKQCLTKELAQWGADHPETIAKSAASYHQRVWKHVRYERGNNEKRRWDDPKCIERHRRWMAANKDRVAVMERAGREVAKAIKKGILTRADTCARCGKTDCKIEASHHDYSTPLDVTWLCRRCHRILDSRNPRTIEYLNKLSQQENGEPK